jgi:hypothetical protein
MWEKAAANLAINVDKQEFERLATWIGERDGMVSSTDGQTVATLFFDVKDCESLQVLLHDVVRDLRADGFLVSGLEFDLVNTTEIADRIGRTRQTVRQYVDGVRGPGHFPVPLGSPGGVRVWDWGSVNEWLRSFDGSGDPEYFPTREFITEFNASTARLLCRSAD